MDYTQKPMDNSFGAPYEERNKVKMAEYLRKHKRAIQ